MHQGTIWRKSLGASVTDISLNFYLFTNPAALWTLSFWIFMAISLQRHHWLNHCPLVMKFNLQPFSPSWKSEGGEESSDPLLMIGPLSALLILRHNDDCAFSQSTFPVPATLQTTLLLYSLSHKYPEPLTFREADLRLVLPSPRWLPCE